MIIINKTNGRVPRSFDGLCRLDWLSLLSDETHRIYMYMVKIYDIA